MTNRDVPFFNEVRNTYASEFFHDSRTFTLDEAKKWFVKTKPTYQIIFYDKKRAGYIKLTNNSDIHKHISIGVVIAPEYTGRGILRSTFDMMLDVFFNKYELHKVSLEVLDTNVDMIEVYEKFGFTIDGTKREDVFKNGQWVSSVIMSILITEYKNLVK